MFSGRKRTGYSRYGILDDIYDEAYAIKDIFLNNNSLRDILESPKLSMENKKELVKDVFLDRLSSQSFGFLMGLVEKNRQKDLISILDYLLDKIKEYKKRHPPSGARCGGRGDSRSR